MEFIFNASPTILYKFFTTADRLIRWYCDAADIQKEVFTYSWGGEAEVAILIDHVEKERLRFKTDDHEDDEYLEFRFNRSPVTNDTILEITDFCDDDEVEESKKLWTTQMGELRVASGGRR